MNHPPHALGDDCCRAVHSGSDRQIEARRSVTLDDADANLSNMAQGEILLGDWLGPPSMSHYRENLLEHVFIAELLQECAFVRHQAVEVLRAEVDDGGYDLVLQMGGIIRHVQLKTRLRMGRARRVQVNANLERHKGGCVVWIFWEVDPSSHRARLTYRWFGDAGMRRTKPLPGTVGRHARGGAERPNIRVLKWGDFEAVDNTAALVVKLFGHRPKGR